MCIGGYTNICSISGLLYSLYNSFQCEILYVFLFKVYFTMIFEFSLKINAEFLRQIAVMHRASLRTRRETDFHYVQKMLDIFLVYD